MIKNKIVLVILIVLLIFIFPYWILFLCFHSNLLSSVAPGWNSTIYPIGEVFKFIALLLTTIFYWKLSKVKKNIPLKKYIIYFLLTIPGVLIISLDFSELFNLNINDPENFMTQIKILVYIKIVIDVMFYIGQVLFLVYYKKSMRKLT